MIIFTALSATKCQKHFKMKRMTQFENKGFKVSPKLVIIPVVSFYKITMIFSIFSVSIAQSFHSDSLRFAFTVETLVDFHSKFRHREKYKWHWWRASRSAYNYRSRNASVKIPSDERNAVKHVFDGRPCVTRLRIFVCREYLTLPAKRRSVVITLASLSLRHFGELATARGALPPSSASRIRPLNPDHLWKRL